MNVIQSERGFEVLTHKTYPADLLLEQYGEVSRLVQQSSAIGEYDDAMDKPGSSYLWVGDAHHLSREEVSDLVGYLNHWLETGKLSK